MRKKPLRPKSTVHRQKGNFDNDRQAMGTGNQLEAERSRDGMGIFDRIISFFAIIAGALLVIMVLIICYGVFMRYFIGRPLSWTLEFTEYILSISTFLVVAWVLAKDGHVKIDILTTNLSPKNRHIVNIIVYFLGILICGFIVWHGVRTTYSLYIRDIVMMKVFPIPKYILVSFVPFGMLLTLIQFIRLLSATLSERSRDRNKSSPTN